VVLVTVSLGINGFHVVKHFMKVRPVPVVLGFEDRVAFLNREIPSYNIFDFINHNLSEETKIFLIYMKNVGYLCERPYYSDSMFESYTMQKILRQAQDPSKVRAALKEGGFTHLLYDINYVYGELSTFSGEEKALFSSFQDSFLYLIKSDKGRYYLYEIL
jgi:hypothetical protein